MSIASEEAPVEIEEPVTAASTFGRFTSATMIATLVAITVLAVCCGALGAVATSGHMVGDSGCAISSTGSRSLAGTFVESSPRIVAALSATAGGSLLLGGPEGIDGKGVVGSNELPSPADPRHGRTRA